MKVNHSVIRAIVGTSIVFALAILAILDSVAPDVCTIVTLLLSVLSLFAWFIVGTFYVLVGTKGK